MTMAILQRSCAMNFGWPIPNGGAPHLYLHEHLAFLKLTHSELNCTPAHGQVKSLKFRRTALQSIYTLGCLTGPLYPLDIRFNTVEA